MRLTKRLKTIAELVEENSNVIDVGCDHALTSIYITKNIKNTKVIASDNKVGPINKALENIKKYNAKNIKTQISDGIEDITEDIDTIILSGLGATTIINILTKDLTKLNNIKTIIISSNNDEMLVRESLNNINYYLEEEILVKENKKIYYIQKYILSNKKLLKQEIKFGKRNIYNNKLFIEDINNKLTKLNIAYKQIPVKNIKTKLNMKKEIRDFKNILKCKDEKNY